MHNNKLNKTSTTTLIALSVVGLSFLILILTVLGVVDSTETMQTQIVQLVSSLLVLVLGFYFGATHQSNQNTNTTTKPPTKMPNPQIFWDITPNGDTKITSINSTPIDFSYWDQFLFDNPDFSIIKDSTDQDVLAVQTNSTMTLGYSTPSGGFTANSVVADFYGTRPVRK